MCFFVKHFFDRWLMAHASENDHRDFNDRLELVFGKNARLRRANTGGYSLLYGTWYRWLEAVLVSRLIQLLFTTTTVRPTWRIVRSIGRAEIFLAQRRDSRPVSIDRRFNINSVQQRVIYPPISRRLYSPIKGYASARAITSVRFIYAYLRRRVSTAPRCTNNANKYAVVYTSL